LPPPQDPEVGDDTLVTAALAGDARAFDALLTRHESSVLRILRLLGVPTRDREDVAQEVFIKVFRHLKGYQRGRSFGGWLYRVSVNAANDYRAREARAGRDETPWIEGLDPEAGAGLDPNAGEVTRRLESALLQLSERERAVFVLREIEGLETHEIARALGITGITVRRHLGLARGRLRGLLANSERKPPSR
jgi:RNA polymerase sigma-70 factor (ECF subfamily)